MPHWSAFFPSLPSHFLSIAMAQGHSKASAAAHSDGSLTPIGKKATGKGKASSASTNASSKKASKGALARTSVTPDNDSPLSPEELVLYKALEKRKRTNQKEMQEKAD